MKILLILSLLISGCVGVSGMNGQNGYSLVYTQLNAPSGSCGYNPDGSSINGTILMIAQDTTHSGVWSEKDTDQQSILICNGQNGINGTNGTSIKTVQFCLNSTNYPTTFAEVGICIDNNIYAVYSTNGGFLTYIPPGNYSSDGINSSCNFTVKTNCEINDE